MTINDLTNAGFLEVGSIRPLEVQIPVASVSPATIPFVLSEINGQAPTGPGVYVFTIGLEVKYAGLTTRSLRNRLARYIRHMNGGPLKRSVHIKMRTALNNGPVNVYVLPIEPDDRFGEWRNGLRLDVIFGLEGWIITEFNLRDEWNIR